MLDERTANHSIPLPHPSNLKTDDVERLRAALRQIDGLLVSQVTILNEQFAALQLALEQQQTANDAQNTALANSLTSLIANYQAQQQAQLNALQANVTAMLNAPRVTTADILQAIDAADDVYTLLRLSE